MIQLPKPDIAAMLLKLKIQLAAAMEKLDADGHLRYAQRMHHYLLMLNVCTMKLKNAIGASEQNSATKELMICLREIESIALACKLGTGLPDGSKIIDTVIGLKKILGTYKLPVTIDRKQLITAQQN